MSIPPLLYAGPGAGRLLSPISLKDDAICFRKCVQRIDFVTHCHML
jgi:hypothetical protein